MLFPNGFVQTQTVPVTLFRPKQCNQSRKEGKHNHNNIPNGFTLCGFHASSRGQIDAPISRSQRNKQSHRALSWLCIWMLIWRINKCMRFVRRRDHKRVVSTPQALAGIPRQQPVEILGLTSL